MIKAIIKAYGYKVLVPIYGTRILVDIMTGYADIRVKNAAWVLALCQAALISEILLFILFYFTT